MLEHMDGRSMKTFITVMEEKSFSKAALKLGYAQSTVTMHIHQLEQTLGQTLFKRLPRGVELTDAGREVAPYAYRYLQLGESLQDKLTGLHEPKGVVRLRALESFCVPHLPQLLPSIFEQYPQIQLQLETGFQRDIIQEVSAYRIDLGIVPRDPKANNLTYIPLIKDELVWVGAPALVNRMENEGWEAIADTKVIGFGSRCIYQTMASQVLADKGLSSFTAMEFDSTEMIKQTMMFGMGLSLMPLTSVKEELQSGKLLRLQQEKTILLEHGLIHRSGKDLSAPVQACKEHIISYFLAQKERETG
ncbi:LysR family transcriptional regulator [Paenibacillus alginolyticus]|uniref:LysR family transcriptional regulator n=1 Tax=Paenibacillus alginolyticus TaxID=59839 RepID=A0ABT4G5R4_9BACL|nr:LysR family transcriptional regulator [Paenibacillus alginolyticus]MCY9691497.1 LysR family transcriptional regulator [Paenibacillus alginolyticus]MEC0146607.1 LysR family transcriptional regulator [Paenibacillus alginolyticus]